jgi:hypothetical protein
VVRHFADRAGRSARDSRHSVNQKHAMNRQFSSISLHLALHPASRGGEFYRDPEEMTKRKARCGVKTAPL